MEKTLSIRIMQWTLYASVLPSTIPSTLYEIINAVSIKLEWGMVRGEEG